MSERRSVVDPKEKRPGVSNSQKPTLTKGRGVGHGTRIDGEPWLRFMEQARVYRQHASDTSKLTRRVALHLCLVASRVGLDRSECCHVESV